MGNIGWINTENYSFDCMLRMERFQIRLMLENLHDGTEPAMAIALKANPEEMNNWLKTAGRNWPIPVLSV